MRHMKFRHTRRTVLVALVAATALSASGCGKAVDPTDATKVDDVLIISGDIDYGSVGAPLQPDELYLGIWDQPPQVGVSALVVTPYRNVVDASLDIDKPAFRWKTTIEISPNYGTLYYVGAFIQDQEVNGRAPELDATVASTVPERFNLTTDVIAREPDGYGLLTRLQIAF